MPEMCVFFTARKMGHSLPASYHPLTASISHQTHPYSMKPPTLFLMKVSEEKMLCEGKDKPNDK